MNALYNFQVTRVMNAQAAGTTNVNGSSVDMLGWDAVMFVAGVGTLTATQVTSMKAQDAVDNATFADITSGATAAAADTDSNKLLILDVVQPQARYVRPVLLRGTANAVIDFVIAIQYRGRKKPVVQPSTTSQSAIVVGN